MQLGRTWPPSALPRPGIFSRLTTGTDILGSRKKKWEVAIKVFYSRCSKTACPAATSRGQSSGTHQGLPREAFGGYTAWVALPSALCGCSLGARAALCGVAPVFREGAPLFLSGPCGALGGAPGSEGESYLRSESHINIHLEALRATGGLCAPWGGIRAPDKHIIKKHCSS